MTKATISLALNTILLAVPFFVYFSIQNQVNIYLIREFIVDYLFYILLVFTLNTSFCFFSFRASRMTKYVCLLEWMVGMIVYVSFFDVIKTY